MRKSYYILLVIILSSCSASWHVKRANKLDPSLFEVKTEIQRDTVTLEVPVVKEVVRLDTLVELVQVDPITKLRTIIKYKIQNDTIMIDCPDPEIVTVTEKVTETITIKPTLWEKARYGVIGLSVLMGLFLLKKLVF